MWASARGESWTSPHRAPGRVEARYDEWGEDHPTDKIDGQPYPDSNW